MIAGNRGFCNLNPGAPPEGEATPPVDVRNDPVSGFKVLTNLLPKRGGNGGNGQDD